MANTQTILKDGFANLERGMDGSKPAQFLKRENVAYAINGTVRGGFFKTRPPFVKRASNLTANARLTWDDVNKVWIPAGRTPGIFQAVDYYAPNSDDQFIVFACDGYIYKVEVNNNFITYDISVPGDRNVPYLPQGWFCQAEEFLVYQDGMSGCYIYDGNGPRRANAALQEVPCGTKMLYALNRLWVVLATTGNEYVASDLVGDESSGSSAFDYRDSVLKFTENDIIAEGGPISIPMQIGPITCLKAPTNVNTAIGQSSIVIFTASGAFVLNVPLDRTKWQTEGSQVVAMLNCGCVSQDAATTVNSDIWFRSKIGVHSFKVAVRNQTDEWVNTPMSREVSPFLDYDTENLLYAADSVYFDDRLLVTTAPYLTQYGVCHRGLVSLDFDIVGTMLEKQPPAWEGAWTGLNILKMVTGEFQGQKRCFLFVLNSSNQIDLWELMTEGEIIHDTISETSGVPIVSHCVTPKYGFDAPDIFKQVFFADIWLGKVAGQVSFNVQYRHDEDPAWHAWHSWTDCAPLSNCVPVNGCLPNQNVVPQWRYNVRLPQPDESCDPVAGRPNRDGYLFQARIIISGYAEIAKFTIRAVPKSEELLKPCPTSTVCTPFVNCPDDPFAYDIE